MTVLLVSPPMSTFPENAMGARHQSSCVTVSVSEATVPPLVVSVNDVPVCDWANVPATCGQSVMLVEHPVTPAPLINSGLRRVVEADVVSVVPEIDPVIVKAPPPIEYMPGADG